MRAKSAVLHVIVGTVSLFSNSGAVAQVVINEFVDDERNATAGQVTPDTREFVELYNAGAEPVDISGWQLLTKQLGANFGQPAGVTTYTLPSSPSEVVPARGFYVIKAPGVSIPSGVGYYEPAFPTGRNLLPDGVTVFMMPEKSTSANYVLELRNSSNLLIDAVADQTSAIPQRENLTNEQLAQVGGGWWGQNSSYNTSPPNLRYSLGRYTDGLDRNINGRDFGMLPMTPGAKNGMSQNSVHTIPDVDAAGFEEPVTQYYASIAMPRAIDPTNLDGNTINPTAIAASPQGGKAIIAYDPAGGGNAIYSKELVHKFDLYAYIEAAPLNLATMTNPQRSEAQVYGLGTTDGLFTTPDPIESITAVTSSTNGSTGVGWMIERVENYNGGSPTTTTSLLLIDFGDGGDSVEAAREWEVMKRYNVSSSGWVRLSIDHDATTGVITAKKDSDTIVYSLPDDFTDDHVVDAADFVLNGKGGILKNEAETPGAVTADDYASWRAHFGDQALTGTIGTFYVGYRNNLGREFAGSRPPTFDMIGEASWDVSTNVPEPSALGLAIIGACWGWAGRRRRL